MATISCSVAPFAARFMTFPGGKESLCFPNLTQVEVGVYPSGQDAESTWICFFAASQPFADVSGFQGECGKAIEIVFDVFCHNFERAYLRVVAFQNPATLRSDPAHLTKGAS
jgi:hypothetical protein